MSSLPIDEKIFMKDMSDSTAYLKYIHERPKSHGLFGNLPEKNISDLTELSSEMYQLSKEKNIYRMVISLDERDALALGYDSKEKWNLYLRNVMPDLARQFNISIDKLQWVAAFHAEPKHPHTHIMFWNSEKKVQSPYIHVTKQNACREILSKKMFEEEYTLAVISKTASRDLVLELGKQVLDEEIEAIAKKTPGIAEENPILSKVTTRQLSETRTELMKLIQELPNSGRLNYKLLPPSVKNQVDRIVKSLLMKNEINAEYMKYQENAAQISATYSPSANKKMWTTENAMDDLNKRLGNLVLKSAKELLNVKDFYSNSIDAAIPSALDSAPDVVLNIPHAIDHLEKSAAQNNSFAFYALGKIYMDPESGIYDANIAINYFLNSANLKNDYAQLKLGNIYLWGKGVSKDEELGKYWLNLAAANGNQFATQSLQAYETFKYQHVLQSTYKMFSSTFISLLHDNRNASSLLESRQYRSKSKVAQKELARKEAARDSSLPE